MEKLIYKDLEWYIMKETEEEKLLLLEDAFTNEQIQEYFKNKNMVDEFFNVRFSEDKRKIWWKDSYIRKVLNSVVLNKKLSKNDLNIMKTSLDFLGNTSVTEDYVRLLKIEEVRELPEKMLRTRYEKGYLTMSPYHYGIGEVSMYGVSGCCIPSIMYGCFADDTYRVRPVISLKSNVLLSKVLNEKEITEQIIRMIYMLNNTEVNLETWITYYKEYEKIKNISGSTELLKSKDALARLLINFDFSDDILNYNEYMKVLLDDLDCTKKLKLN